VPVKSGSFERMARSVLRDAFGLSDQVINPILRGHLTLKLCARLRLPLLLSGILRGGYLATDPAAFID